MRGDEVARRVAGDDPSPRPHAVDTYSEADLGERAVRYPRSETPFAVEFRILLFAGLLWSASWIAQRCVQPRQSRLCMCFTMLILSQANSLRRLVLGDDESI